MNRFWSLLSPVLILSALSFGAVVPLSHAAIPEGTATVRIDAFVREDCIHCIAQKEFFRDLSQRRSDLQIVEHDIANPEERALFDRVAQKAGLPKATPLTLIGGQVVQGFGSSDTTGKYLVELIDRAKGQPRTTVQDFLDAAAPTEPARNDGGCDESGSAPCALQGDGSAAYLVEVPFVGAVDMKRFSLPAIAAILGFVDGFNPCAMWVLVTFLIVLLQVGDRRKVYQIAGLFIAAETIMYYLILNVWYAAWDFIGLDRIVTPVVGLIAVGAGAYFLYEGWTSDGTCKVTNLEQKRKTHLRISDIAARPFTLLSAIAVIGLALSVNVIEFACSVGIPQTFTKILDLNGLGLLERQAMMAIYILLYMVDDFIVFGLALWGSQHLGLTTKYAKWCNVLGGILMLALGSILVLAPQLLKFA